MGIMRILKFQRRVNLLWNFLYIGSKCRSKTSLAETSLDRTSLDRNGQYVWDSLSVKWFQVAENRLDKECVTSYSIFGGKVFDLFGLETDRIKTVSF